MKINTLLKQKTKHILVSLSMIVLPVATLIATPALVGAQQSKKTCGGVDTAILTCREKGQGGIADSGVIGILNIVINIMTIAVGVVSIGALVFAGILYAAAADNEEQVKKAKDIIRNTVIGLVLYAGMFMLARYLIPGSGGLF